VGRMEPYGHVARYLLDQICGQLMDKKATEAPAVPPPLEYCRRWGCQEPGCWVMDSPRPALATLQSGR
jgi:hypothetical protein